MKTIFLYTRIYLKLVLLIIYSCGKTENHQNNESLKTYNTKDTAKIKNYKIEKTNFELLQGKWQSTDDKTNFLVFCLRLALSPTVKTKLKYDFLNRFGNTNIKSIFVPWEKVWNSIQQLA